MLEFIERVTPLDIFLLLIWAGLIIYGFFTGIMRQVFLSASVIVGAILGSAIAGPLSVWTGPMSGAGREAILPFTFTVLATGITLVAYVLVIRTYPRTKLVAAPALDALGGGAVGFASGLLVTTQLLLFTLALTRTPWALFDGARSSIYTQASGGPLYALILGTFPLVAEGLGRLVPTL